MKKALSLVLTLAMLLCVAVSAGSAEAAPYGGLDLSEPLVVSMYYTGNESADWERVENLINEKLAAKVNTTINFVHVSFADFMTSYSLYLNDPDVDILYCQPTNNFGANAMAGAFLPISEEFLKTYMPLTWEKENPSLWREVTVNGEIYGIPANRIDGTCNGVITSRTLMDKYGYTEDMITNISELSEYLKVVSAGEKENGIYGINCQGAWPSDWIFLGLMSHAFTVNDGTSCWFSWKYAGQDHFNVDDMYWIVDSEEYLQWALMMADWYKSGVYQAGVMSNETTLEANTKEGLSVINMSDPAYAATLQDFYTARGDEMVYLDCLADDETRVFAISRGHSIVFPINSKHMERAAIVADLLKFDPEIHALIVGGIEGEHYTLTEDGKYRVPTEKAVNYPWANRCFFLVDNADPELQLNDYLQPYLDLNNSRKVGSELFPVGRFNFDRSKFDAEIAAMDSIFNEYRFAFCFGLYGDETQAKVEELRTIMHAAGIDKVLDEYKAQVHAYLGE